MAGSISKESRGLNTKNRADLRIFLNGTGLRVDSEESQGFFNKITRLKGYALIWTTGSNFYGPD
jgi:hypothetical protein